MIWKPEYIERLRELAPTVQSYAEAVKKMAPVLGKTVTEGNLRYIVKRNKIVFKLIDEREKVKSDNWTPEIVERLKELVLARKATSSMIAAQINKEFDKNITSKALIGKVYRLGLTIGETVPHSTRVQGKKKTKKRLIPRDLVDRTDMLSVPLLDLTRIQCAWPINGAAYEPCSHYCGHSVVQGSSFCENHHYRAFSRYENKTA